MTYDFPRLQMLNFVKYLGGGNFSRIFAEQKVYEGGKDPLCT